MTEEACDGQQPLGGVSALTARVPLPPRRPAAAVGGCEEEEGRVQTQVLDEQGGWTGRDVGGVAHWGLLWCRPESLPPLPAV